MPHTDLYQLMRQAHAVLRVVLAKYFQPSYFVSNSDSQHCYTIWSIEYTVFLDDTSAALDPNDNERNLFTVSVLVKSEIKLAIYLDVFALLVHDHNFREKLLRMGWNRFLADMLDKFAELHGKSFFALLRNNH